MENEQVFISARYGKRILAYLFDLALNLAVGIVLLVPSLLALVNVYINKNNANIAALFVSSLFSGALVVSFSIFYFVCLPVFWDGQTVGKRFFNIRIIDITTNEGPIAKVMFIREAIRILLFLLSFGLSAIADLIILCISEKNASFHDQISSTKVVNVNIYPNKDSNSNTNNLASY